MPAIAENIKKVAVIKTGEQTQFIELDQVSVLSISISVNYVPLVMLTEAVIACRLEIHD